jgi:hypothetical protein
MITIINNRRGVISTGDARRREYSETSQRSVGPTVETAPAAICTKRRAVRSNKQGGISMLKFVIARRGQTRRRPQRSVRSGIRALGFGGLAAIVVASSATGAMAQQTPAEKEREFVRARGLTAAGNVADAARALAYRAPSAKCRTAEVEKWLKRALDLEAREPPLVDPETPNGKRWLDLRQAIILESNLPPCPGFVPVFSNGGVLLGIYLIKVTGDGHFTEQFVSTDQITNVFNERKDPVGGGLLLGYKFNAGGNIGVMPFLSVDFPNISVNHSFANGSFLGTTSGIVGTIGVKAGPQIQNVWLYGIAGVSALGESLKVDFLPVTSSTDTIVPGGTIGAGFAYTLPNFSEVSLFAEYQHTWWRAGKFNTPLASPLFDYSFARQDDVVKVGFTVSLGAPPLPAGASALPVKVLTPK